MINSFVYFKVFFSFRLSLRSNCFVHYYLQRTRYDKWRFVDTPGGHDDKDAGFFVLVLNSSFWVYWSMKIKGEIFVVQGIYDDSDLLFNQI